MRIWGRVLGLFFLALVGASGWSPELHAQVCTRWASPAGGGTGVAAFTPFQIKDFWPVASPGSVLCLLDGTYTGVNSQVAPSTWVTNLSGQSGLPITVRAVNDGGVLIDGEGVRVPLSLINNNWLVVEGINFARSNASVVQLVGSSNNIVRRVVAWDAADYNNDLYSASSNSNFNLFEDVGGFGVARKIFSAAQGGNDTIYRRAWGRWEGSTNVGPKLTCQPAYNNERMLFENALCTWDNGSMPATYTLQHDGVLWTGAGAGTYTGGQVQDPFGIFADASNSEPSAYRVLYSLAYLPTSARFDPAQLIWGNAGEGTPTGCGTGIEHSTYSNVGVGIVAGSHTGKLGFNMLSCGAAAQLILSNTVTFGGAGNSIAGNWQATGISLGATVNDVPSIYSGLGICMASQNGALTTTPLWPWPMNARILAATTLANAGGHTHKIHQGNPPKLTDLNDPHAITNVTAEIEALFGAIPSNCRSETLPGPSATLVGAPAKIPARYTINATVTNAPGNTTDWIGMYVQGNSGANFLQWRYLNGQQTPPPAPILNATIPFIADAATGNYEFQVYQNNSVAPGDLMATTAFHAFQGRLVIESGRAVKIDPARAVKIEGGS